MNTTLSDFMTTKQISEINAIFIEQQTRYNRYVNLNYDCHGPLLQLSDFVDCYTVFGKPIPLQKIPLQKRKKPRSAESAASAASTAPAVDYLNITGHFELHSSLTALQERIDAPSSLHVKLEDYIDFLLPFRRSNNLKIDDHNAGWTIDDDQRINVGEPNGVVMTNGNVRIKKAGAGAGAGAGAEVTMLIPFHRLLRNNLDIFERFQNKVNIISGHNLCFSLIDENTLLFIYDLLTDESFSSKNRQQRLKEIIDKLNETHQRVVNQTVSRLLYEINCAAAATAAHYLPDELRVLHHSYPEPENDFKLSVAQLSSTPRYESMSCRYFLGGLSVVGTSDDDTFTCDPTQTIIDQSLISLVQSLAFTISFRVDMHYKGDDYLFSFKLDRDILNHKVDQQGGKCVFKHSDIIQHIVSESFKSCVIGALDKKASSSQDKDKDKEVIQTIKDGINTLWSERTIDLILDGCAAIDRCFTPFDVSGPSRLDLVFHSKVEGSDGSLILRPNPRDALTNRSIARLFQSAGHAADPVVNVHVHFSEIDENDVLSAFLSKAPFGDTVVKWIDLVNKYDESISNTLLQVEQGNDLSSILSSVSRSLSQHPSQSRSVSSSRGHDAEGAPSRVRDTSVKPPQTRQLLLDEVLLHEKEQPMTASMLQQFIDDLPDGRTTQIPPNDCVSGGGSGGASAPVGYFTRFKSALKELITFLFSRPTTRNNDYDADMCGGRKLQKTKNTTIRRRHNKKQSQKKYKYRIKKVKTKQRIKRKRTTYKK